MLGMVIAIGSRPNRVAFDGVGDLGGSGGGRRVERGVATVLAVIRPAAAGGGRGGGV